MIISDKILTLYVNLFNIHYILINTIDNILIEVDDYLI